MRQKDGETKREIEREAERQREKERYINMIKWKEIELQEKTKKENKSEKERETIKKGKKENNPRIKIQGNP